MHRKPLLWPLRKNRTRKKNRLAHSRKTTPQKPLSPFQTKPLSFSFLPPQPTSVRPPPPSPATRKPRPKRRPPSSPAARPPQRWWRQKSPVTCWVYGVVTARRSSPRPVCFFIETPTKNQQQRQSPPPPSKVVLCAARLVRPRQAQFAAVITDVEDFHLDVAPPQVARCVHVDVKGGMGWGGKLGDERWGARTPTQAVIEVGATDGCYTGFHQPRP